jgi:hypothetical protein
VAVTDPVSRGLGLSIQRLAERLSGEEFIQPFPQGGRHMCPACLTTLALAVGTASSAGGVAALLLRRFYVLRHHRNPSRVSRAKETSP